MHMYVLHYSIFQKTGELKLRLAPEEVQHLTKLEISVERCIPVQGGQKVSKEIWPIIHYIFISRIHISRAIKYMQLLALKLIQENKSLHLHVCTCKVQTLEK